MNSFVALDVETANSFRGSLCAIGLVKFENGKMTDFFYSHINPEEEFDPFNTFIHGITPEDVKDAPTFPTLRPKLIEFIDGLPVVAHFAQFDMNALKDAYIKYQLPFDDIRYFCSYYVSKFANPGQISYKLNHLAEVFNFELIHHEALSDAKVCGQLICKMMELTGNTDLETFLTSLRYKKFGVLGEHGFTRTSIRHQYSPKNKFYIPTEEEQANMDQTNPVYGARFVFTGKLEHFTRQEAAKEIALLGGIPEGNVTTKTNYLVIGEQDFRIVGQSGQSNKMRKAFELLGTGQEIEILSELDFLKLL
ncbi:TPA: 3'-5' exoribonuclease [Streptococcus suis]|uniref:exonuclease domain-containing protein n=1 Tax=Streptococcus suis TaxID=1307 RepID=UPI0009430CEB|nr:exonuclease domain-containing protein [Streptococcus suis]HEL2352243.1 3'-5' exoribonuclease [Streptococcus suis]HEM4065187.1 3'-5' exoribonuclease [Streptococcus suis]